MSNRSARAKSKDRPMHITWASNPLLQLLRYQPWAITSPCGQKNAMECGGYVIAAAITHRLRVLSTWVGFRTPTVISLCRKFIESTWQPSHAKLVRQTTVSVSYPNTFQFWYSVWKQYGAIAIPLPDDHRAISRTRHNPRLASSCWGTHKHLLDLALVQYWMVRYHARHDKANVATKSEE